MAGPRLTVYLTNPVADRLELASVRKRTSKSALVNEALDRMLNAQRDETHEAGQARRLDRLAKQFASYERNQSVALETLALFIRYYLSVTAPMPKSEQDASRLIGNQRFEAFVAQVGKRLASGTSTMNEAMEKDLATDPDLQRRDPDESVLESVSSAILQPSSGPSSVSGGPGRGGEAPAQRGQGFASRPPDVAPGASSPVTGDDHG
jgi:hypothetical protein